MSNEEKTNDYENFEKGMIYMKILKKRGVVEKRGGGEDTRSMPHAPVLVASVVLLLLSCNNSINVRENRRSNQVWTIQRHRKHCEQDTE